LTQFLGTSHGLPAAAITRLARDWQDEATTFSKRSLAGTGYLCCWVGGIHLKVRLEQDKVCLLVMIGVRADGTRELIALDDGHRESTGSSLDLLRGCKRRGMAAPVLAVGDYGTRWPKAAAKITDDLDVLLAFCDYPAEHWIRLRTTSPIWVRLRRRQASPASHQGAPAPAPRCRDGVQAHRISTDPVAGRQRTPPRRAGPCRGGSQERQAHRTTRRIRGW
jgi:transposase-like protein